MATPLDLRNRRREAQRTVRLALNAVNSALDNWKRAATEGKKHANDLSNLVLTERLLPLRPLGALSEVPGLLPAASAKLQQQQEQQLQSLQVCLQQLQNAVEGLSAAVESIASLVAVEAEAPLLGNGAVFAALSLQTIGRMLGEVVEMHQAELKVKEAVVSGFQKIPGEFLHRGSGGPRKSVGGSGSKQDGILPGDKLESTMQVYITAWLLSPEIEERRVETHLACITEDMRGF